MKQLTHRLSVKIIAIVLFICSILLAGLSAFGILFAWQTEIYNGETSFFDTDWCEHLVRSSALSMLYDYENGDTETDLQDWYGNSNLSVTALQKGDSETKLFEVNSFEGVIAYELEIDTSTEHFGYEGDYILHCSLPTQMKIQDKFLLYNNLFNRVLPLRNALIAVLCFSVVLTLVLLVFLCFAAGHRGETNEIFLNPFDRIPLDLYLCGQVVLFSIGIICITEVFENFSFLPSLILCAALVGVLALLGIATLMTIATRIKYGTWWKNTLCYRLSGFVKRTFFWLKRTSTTLLHALPISWRSTLIAAAILLINIFLGFQSQYYYWGGGALVLLLLFDLVVLAGVVLISLQLRTLQAAGKRLASGDFSQKTETKHLFWDFRQHAENLNAIGDGMLIAIDERMRSEHLKTELITNLSHDIKTPLTSIISYVDLLQHAQTEEQKTEYLSVLDRQAKRLKKLTEDLLEASKACTGNLPVELQPVHIDELFSQCLGEYSDRLAAVNLETVVQLSDPQLQALADGGHLWRVLDNLLSNVCKYALPHTRVYLDAVQRDQQVILSVKNISRAALNIDADELMERFVRGDIARSSEGNGLGLSIARSLVELMNGTFQLIVDGDLFKVEILLPAVA
ncbi:MAG: sensor histidine kinase [Oscillospiraceae bacterium]|jgi:signal transduction histidine kinase